MNSMREALRRLLAVCEAMDAEREAARPTKAEKKAAKRARTRGVPVTKTTDGEQHG